MGVPADAQHCLLQVSVAGQNAALHDSIDSTVDHDADAFGHGAGYADVLLDHQNLDAALLSQADEHVFDLLNDDGSQAFRRLIHDKQFRVQQERPRDGEHLLLAARQLRAAVGFPFRKSWESRINPFPRPRAALAADQAKVFIDRERRPKSPPLRNVTDAQPRDLGRALANE